MAKRKVGDKNSVHPTNVQSGNNKKKKNNEPIIQQDSEVAASPETPSNNTINSNDLSTPDSGKDGYKLNPSSTEKERPTSPRDLLERLEVNRQLFSNLKGDLFNRPSSSDSQNQQNDDGKYNNENTSKRVKKELDPEITNKIKNIFEKGGNPVSNYPRTGGSEDISVDKLQTLDRQRQDILDSVFSVSKVEQVLNYSNQQKH